MNALVKWLVKKLLFAGMLLAAVSSPVVLGASEAKGAEGSGAGGASAAAEVRIVNEENATENERRFIAAVKADDLDTVQLLCAEDLGLITARYQVTVCNIGITDPDPTRFTTPFNFAVYLGHTDMVTTFFRLLNLTPENPDALPQFAAIKNSYGDTPLHLAAWNSHTATVTALFNRLQPLGLTLESFAQLKNNEGQTPLHLAAYYGKTETIIELFNLLQPLGLNLESFAQLKNNNGNTPLHTAAWNGHTKTIIELFNLLQPLGLNLESFAQLKNNNGNTPLHLAALNGYTATVTALFNLLQPLGLNLESFAQLKSNQGNTPLHLAAWDGKVDVVRYFIETAHIKQSLQNNNHETPLTLAIRRRRNLSPAEVASPLAPDLETVICYLADISPDHISSITHEPYGDSKPVTIFPCGHHIETEYVASIVPQRCPMCRGPITPSLQITSPAGPFVTARVALERQEAERRRGDNGGAAAGGAAAEPSSGGSGGGSGSGGVSH